MVLALFERISQSAQSADCNTRSSPFILLFAPSCSYPCISYRLRLCAIRSGRLDVQNVTVADQTLCFRTLKATATA